MEFQADIEEVNTGSEEKVVLTPEQEKEVVNAFFDGKDAPDFLTNAPDTQEVPAPDTPSQTAAAEPAQQTPGAVTDPDTETLKREIETLRQRYENAARKITEQGTELGRLRTQPPPAPARPAYTPPTVPSPGIPEPFDFSDPNSIAKLARQEAARMLDERDQAARAQEENQRTANWNGTIKAQKQLMSVELNIPETVIDDSISRFHADVQDGNIPAMAYVWNNRESIIQAAEKRGYDQALAQFKAAQNQPRRAAASSSKTATETGKKVTDMSFDELQAEVKSLPPNSPRLNEIAEILMKAGG